MCKTFIQRIAVASVVATHIKQKITDGAPNIQNLVDGGGRRSSEMKRSLDDVRSEAAVAYAVAADSLQSYPSQIQEMARFRLLKNLAKKYEVANCGEYARYAFLKLYKKGVRPIAYVQVENVEVFENHACVAIGIGTAADANMSTWPEDVVICDPWLSVLLAAKGKSGDELKGAYGVAEYLKLTSEWFDDGDKVGIWFAVEGDMGAVPKK